MCFELFHHYGQYCASMEPGGLIYSPLLENLPKWVEFDVSSLDFGHWFARLAYGGIYFKVHVGWDIEMQYQDIDGELHCSKC